MPTLSETQLDYTVETGKPFAEAVAAVEAAAAEHGFRVLHVHDVAATLAGKGLERAPYKIVEICNAVAAHEALAQDPLIGLMLPCKVNVYTEDGRTKLSAMRPALLPRFFPGAGLEALAERVEQTVIAIVDQAK